MESKSTKLRFHLLFTIVHHTTCCYGLDLECLQRAHVLKTWFLMQQYSLTGPSGGDWIIRTLTFINGLIPLMDSQLNKL